MFERILVPLDGSKTAEVVIPYVTEIAARCGSLIVLARVCEPNMKISECNFYLENVAKGMWLELNNLQANEKTKMETSVLFGNPAEILIYYASEIDCNLIIIASRGASNQSQWPLGNVATKILHASRRPILLIREQINNSAVTAHRLIKKLMVPLDGSNLSEAALPLAAELSTVMEADVVLFRVIEQNIVITGPGLAMTRELATEYGSPVIANPLKTLVFEYLKNVKEYFEKKGIKAYMAIGEGQPADEIIDYAEANSIDLIIMSTHGRSGIGRWVFGSVTDKVLRAGNTPVLVVRPGENVTLIVQ